VKNVYAEETRTAFDSIPEPKILYEVAKGTVTGNQIAAINAFNVMAEACGDAIANTATLIDGLIVIGGGLSGAHDLFLPRLVDEMNSNYQKGDGSEYRRLTQKVYNLEKPDQLTRFLTGSTKELKIIGTDKIIKYDPESRLGVGISKIGTSYAISLGAYAYALNKLN
jgi:glucokinase